MTIMISLPASEHPCNLCDSTEVTVVGQRSRSGRPLRTVACRACGLVWSDPRPIEARKFYQDDYRLAYKRTYEPKPKHVLRAGRVALARLAKIRHLLSGRRRVLDIGSGGGEFAYLMKRLGHQVRGIEPNLGYARYAAHRYELDITLGFVGEVLLPEREHDLITIWHVLEHTENPAAVLRKLRDALAPKGMLVVEVPNVEARCQAPASTFHEAHLFNFNSATLVAMAAKAGLEPVSMRLSEDGGNITAVLRAASLNATPQTSGLPGNHARVTDCLRVHTPFRHWMRLQPYRRAARRLAGAVGEWLRVRTLKDEPNLLDRVYDEALQAAPVATRDPVAAVPFPWAKVCAVYVVAVLLEWLLLDRAFDLHAMSDGQAMAAYLGTQALIVGGVARKFWPSRNTSSWLRITAFGGPLFLLPVYC